MYRGQMYFSRSKCASNSTNKGTKSAKIDIAINYTEAKVLGNYEKKLKLYSNIEYLVKYFAIILNFCLLEN